MSKRESGISNIEWLLREAVDEQPSIVNQHMVVDDAQWRASIERLQIGPGLRVFLTEITAHREVTLEARDDRTDQWMATQVTIEGEVAMDFRDGASAHSAADQIVMFRAPRRRVDYNLAAGMHYRAAGYGLDIGRLDRLFDGDVPGALKTLLDREVAAARVVTVQSDRRVRRLAKSLFARNLNGPLRALNLEGTVLLLFAAQVAALERRSRRGSWQELSASERDAVHEARRRLLADMRQPPSLGELAASVGLTDKRLNACFRALFGTTVFEALRNERLEHARLALQVESVPLKGIAFRVGYNHVGNFITAFTNRFGAPPRRYVGEAD